MSWPWIIAVLALWAAILILAVVVLGLLRRVSSFVEAAELRLRGASIPPGFGGIEPGELVPNFEVTDEEGRVVPPSIVMQPSTLLVFMDPGCEPCEDLAGLMQSSWDMLQDVPVVIIAEHTGESATFPFPPGSHVFYQANKSASKAFQNIAAPQAFAVKDGVVLAKSIPDSRQDLERLVRLLGKGGEVDRSHAGRGVVTT